VRFSIAPDEETFEKERIYCRRFYSKLRYVGPGLRFVRRWARRSGKMMEYDRDGENVDHIAAGTVLSPTKLRKPPRIPGERTRRPDRCDRDDARWETASGDPREKGQQKEGSNSEGRNQPRAKGLQKVQQVRVERELIPVTEPAQVLEGMTEAEAREFWDTHELTEEYRERVCDSLRR
jgi:hypothetical protein